MDMDLLQAIGQMLDEKLEQKFSVKLQPIYDELDAIRQRMLKIEVTQENIIEKRLTLISEEVLDINEKLDRSLIGRLQLEDHEYRIQSLEQTVKAALP